MPKSNQTTVVGVMPQTPPADDKWKQQVRLACVQAVSARAVASGAVYDVGNTILAANALTNFVLTGAKSD